MANLGSDPNSIYPNEAIKQVCCIKNVITRPNIEVGDYTYYDDINGPEKFQDHVAHHYEFIGDGAIIGANSVVTRDIPPYCVAGGNPCRVLRPRFDRELTEYLLRLKWWDWPAEKIFRNLEALCSSDLTRIKEITE